MNTLKYIKNDTELLKSSKILIVEDDRTQRILLRGIFDELGFHNVIEASDGKEGWEKTLQFIPDLVVLDINMPVMNGFEYCKAARNSIDHNDMTILVQTGLVDLENKAEIFKAGATDYVTKPVDFSEIVARSLIHLKNAQNVKELKAYNTRVKTEISAAKNLVDISLPDSRSIKTIKSKYKIDIAAKLESSQDLGGDFWGFTPVNKNKLVIYTIDVSGHGIDSALSALRIHTLLHANAGNLGAPGEVLEWLNKKLLRLFPPGQFATMFYAVIDTEHDEMQYATSSTTSPILLKQNKFPPEMISGKGYPLGVIDNADFKTRKIAFKKGDTLILYSDAITEAKKNGNNMLGEEGFINLLKKSFSKQQKFDCKVILSDTLNMFHKEYGEKLDDDLTINFYHRLP